MQGWCGLSRRHLNRQRSCAFKRLRVNRKVRVHCREESPDGLKRVLGADREIASTQSLNPGPARREAGPAADPRAVQPPGAAAEPGERESTAGGAGAAGRWMDTPASAPPGPRARLRGIPEAPGSSAGCPAGGAPPPPPATPAHSGAGDWLRPPLAARRSPPPSQLKQTVPGAERARREHGPRAAAAPAPAPPPPPSPPPRTQLQLQPRPRPRSARQQPRRPPCLSAAPARSPSPEPGASPAPRPPRLRGEGGGDAAGAAAAAAASDPSGPSYRYPPAPSAIHQPSCAHQRPPALCALGRGRSPAAGGKSQSRAPRMRLRRPSVLAAARGRAGLGSGAREPGTLGSAPAVAAAQEPPASGLARLQEPLRLRCSRGETG
ncbi:basic proline-rich protein-like [Rhinolophus ferrumequinum]|uniref:basic proline-rich protein-like n=1 Tax=Rhinolophus ferrumequinum TaxID=59479 RepID=UPI00140FF4D2|nr:basic proline-rich protein-like [Rhinolophus ferrumequinum]